MAEPSELPSIAQMREQMQHTIVRRLREWEAEHGTITPAPRGTRPKRHSTGAENMALLKRKLIEAGWMQE